LLTQQRQGVLEKVNDWYEALPQKTDENKLNVWLGNQN
jgi:hypothetical protein